MPTNTTQSGIFIVMKYPEKGEVKSRLAKSIGEDSATNLYRAFIQDTIDTVESLEFPFHLAISPPDAQEQFTRFLGFGYNFFPQRGANLGERLRNGFHTMFDAGYTQVIALASDCPDLPAHLLKEAFSCFQSHDVVLGPAPDGGYYLIGFSKDTFIPEAFDSLSWSTDTVLQETLARIKPFSERIHLLSEWQDIDTKNDLREFYNTHQLQTSTALRSMTFLRSHPELVKALFS
ncbi:MAG: TIGR04282 family arsenosugar biosynthesis glycosyltransferase [Candidatus Thorarchaeota archaeon]